MGKISKKIRQLVADRAEHCCEYCLSQAKFSPDYFSIEHIIPSIKQGVDHPDNLAYSCLSSTTINLLQLLLWIHLLASKHLYIIQDKTIGIYIFVGVTI